MLQPIKAAERAWLVRRITVDGECLRDYAKAFGRLRVVDSGKLFNSLANAVTMRVLANAVLIVSPEVSPLYLPYSWVSGLVNACGAVIAGCWLDRLILRIQCSLTAP